MSMEKDLKRSEDIEVLSGQLVAQNMMLQMLLGQVTLHGSDHGAELRHALEAGLGGVKGNPNMTQREKFGFEKTRGCHRHDRSVACKGRVDEVGFSAVYFQNHLRALIYDQVGCRAQARREFEQLYAEDPSFENLRQQLGSVASAAAPTATFSADQT